MFRRAGKHEHENEHECEALHGDASSPECALFTAVGGLYNAARTKGKDACMRTLRTCLALRLAGLVLLAAALAGCTSGAHYEKGEVLNTEQQNAQRVPEYKLQGFEHLDRVPPILAVWVDTRNKVTAEERDVYQKVQVTGRRRLSFEPTFLLWPWNVARTPVGLVGCVFSGTDMALHYVAGAVGAVAGVAGAILTYAVVVPLHIIGQGQVSDVTGFGLGADLAQVFIFTLETPLLLLDFPHKFLHGTSIYPVAMNRKDFPEGWGKGISRSWHYAWDYQVYPPFIIWARTDEVRSDVPGETITGNWARRDHYEDWAIADTDSITVESGGRTRSVGTLAGIASINLRELAAGLGRADTLRLTVKVETPEGPLSRDFSFGVADLLSAP